MRVIVHALPHLSPSPISLSLSLSPSFSVSLFSFRSLAADPSQQTLTSSSLKVVAAVAFCCCCCLRVHCFLSNSLVQVYSLQVLTPLLTTIIRSNSDLFLGLCFIANLTC